MLGTDTVDDGMFVDPDGNSTPGTVTEFQAPDWQTEGELPEGDPADFYGLGVPEDSTVQLVLAGLPADFDLQLLRRDGTAVAESTLTGWRRETLRADLTAAPSSGRSGQRPGVDEGR